jgi:hypothetical protein
MCLAVLKVKDIDYGSQRNRSGFNLGRHFANIHGTLARVYWGQSSASQRRINWL